MRRPGALRVNMWQAWPSQAEIVPSTKSPLDAIGAIPRVGGPKYNVAVVATAATYTITATAIGPMAGDACATLSIDQTGLRTFTGGAGSQELCWNR